jgi:ABC-2 type transport system permease protein
MNATNGNSQSKLHGLWALTNRELKKWYKAPVIFILSIIQPVLWMGLLGKAMNIGAIFSGGTFSLPTDLIQKAQFTPTQLQLLGDYFAGLQTTILKGAFNTTDYFSFMAVGMIAFTALFTTMFSGMSVVWDRRLGFMNKVLSTPVSRAVIIFSKVLSATLRSMFQAGLIIVIAMAFGLQFGIGFNPLYVLGVFGIMFLICIGLSSVFIAITIRSTRIETPMAVVNLINLPLMFASNAFFPTKFMPDWLQTIARFNPLTYTTDAVRQLLIFTTDWGQLALDFLYVGIFAAIAATIGIVLSWRFLSK